VEDGHLIAVEDYIKFLCEVEEGNIILFPGPLSGEHAKFFNLFNIYMVKLVHTNTGEVKEQAMSSVEFFNLEMWLERTGLIII